MHVPRSGYSVVRCYDSLKSTEVDVLVALGWHVHFSGYITLFLRDDMCANTAYNKFVDVWVSELGKRANSLDAYGENISVWREWMPKEWKEPLDSYSAWLHRVETTAL